MRAAQFHGQRDIRISEVPNPEPKPGEVLVSIEWCGICGSDLHEYLIGPSVIPHDGHHHSISGSTMPITLGHEFCGRILDANDAPSLSVGQAVMVDPRLYCSSCPNCTSSATNACSSWGFRGLSGGGGGLSELVAVDARMCYALPEEVSLREAALIEPLTVAHHALVVSGFDGEFGEKAVLVLGGGPVGIAVMMCLRAQGKVGRLVVSEPTVKRTEQNKEIADVVLDPLNENVGERCRELTGGKGVDVVFDCAGILPGLNQGMDALGFRGVYVNVAGWEKPFILPFGSFMFKEITLKASFSYTDEDFRTTVEKFKAGTFKNVEKLVTNRILLEDVVKKGFEELVSNKDSHIKILVTPKREYITNL